MKISERVSEVLSRHVYKSGNFNVLNVVKVTFSSSAYYLTDNALYLYKFREISSRVSELLSG